VLLEPINQWGTIYQLIAIFFATKNIGGAKELLFLCD